MTELLCGKAIDLSDNEVEDNLRDFGFDVRPTKDGRLQVIGDYDLWRRFMDYVADNESESARTVALANPRLIAAAPELLDKCEWAQLYIRKLECSCKPEVPCWRCIVLEKLNDVIAMAKGEEQQ